MATGTVKWFNTTKGFGFIAPESGGKDVFVHISAVERAGLTGLADNQKVEYELEAGRDGRESATNISLAD
ncbi:MAG TPA: cold-shock protein [Aliiroseovarius sp.]|nr:cold-shock protein [Aliiroseovarius sp.]